VAEVSDYTPPPRRRWLLGVGVVAAVALLGLGAGKLVSRFMFEPAAAPALDGNAVYALSMPDLAGQSQPFEQWRGKVLVVNFWATWCGPCREEMPALVAAQARYGGKGLQVVGIGIDDVGKMREFAKSLQLNYPALDGGFGALELSKTLGNSVMALPFTLVIDRKGAIVRRQLGPMNEQYLASIASQLL
jgi:thiol-disulfide isomerase/thioredoxin